MLAKLLNLKSKRNTVSLLPGKQRVGWLVTLTFLLLLHFQSPQSYPQLCGRIPKAASPQHRLYKIPLILLSQSHSLYLCQASVQKSVLPDAQVSPARGGKFAPLSWLFQIKSSKLTHSSETEHWLQPSLPSYTSSPVDPMDLLLSSSNLSLLYPSPQP